MKGSEYLKNETIKGSEYLKKGAEAQTKGSECLKNKGAGLYDQEGRALEKMWGRIIG